MSFGALVQSNTTNTASGTSNTCTFTSAVVAGDILNVTVRCGQPAATIGVSDSAGNVYVQDMPTTATISASANFSVASFTCRSAVASTAGSNVVTVTQSGAAQTIRTTIAEFTGPGALDAAPTPTVQETTATPSSGNAVTSQAVELLILIEANDLGGGTLTFNSPGTGAGTVNSISVIDQKISVSYSITTASGTYTSSGTYSSGAVHFVSAILAYAQADSEVQLERGTRGAARGAARGSV